MTCARHPFRYSMCDDCRTPPESNLMLAALRAAWQEAPDPADLPIELSDRMEGGMVTQVRTFSWEELVERLERDVAGDAT